MPLPSQLGIFKVRTCIAILLLESRTAVDSIGSILFSWPYSKKSVLERKSAWQHLKLRSKSLHTSMNDRRSDLEDVVQSEVRQGASLASMSTVRRPTRQIRGQGSTDHLPDSEKSSVTKRNHDAIDARCLELTAMATINMPQTPSHNEIH